VERCRSTLERALALAKTGEEMAEIHGRIARMESDAHGPEAAEAHWRAALEASPRHLPAIEALEKLARARGAWADVADLLERRIGLLGPDDEEARQPLYVDLAQLFGQRLGQPGRALPYLEEARKRSPDEPAVLEPLAELYFAADRLDEALPLYQSLAERLQKARRMKEVARLRSRIGAIAEKRGDRAQAQKEYAEAHRIDPAHAPTMVALARLHMAAEEWEKARGILRKMLLQNIDPESGISKADVYQSLGTIHEQLNEAPKALGMYERGLEIEPGHAGLRAALERLRNK
jgi:tetratricopeptide (TPR) repeat protein